MRFTIVSAALAACILLIPACSKDSNPTIIPGYINPGTFEAKNLSGQKSFNIAGYSGSGANCLAVYTIYWNNAYKTPITGAAVKNNDMTLKIYPALGGWSITLLRHSDGKLFTGIASAGEITFTPGYDNSADINPDPAITWYQNLMTIAFTANVTLTAGTDTATVNNGDTIVAIAPGVHVEP